MILKKSGGQGVPGPPGPPGSAAGVIKQDFHVQILADSCHPPPPPVCICAAPTLIAVLPFQPRYIHVVSGL